jgi:hypothetical protein
MHNKAKASKAAVAGVLGLAAGVASTVGLAAAASDSKDVERPKSASAAHYTGPRTADAAEAWLGSGVAYSGPTTPDAAEAWFGSGVAYSGPTTPDAAEAWFGSGVAYSGPTSSPDATELGLAGFYDGCQVYSAGGLGTRPGCSPG